MKTDRAFLAVSLIALALALPVSVVLHAEEKNSFTPIALDAGFGRLDPAPPATSADEIIRMFAAKESEFQQALNRYAFRRSARVQTLDEDGKVDGEYYQVDDVLFTPSGQRTERTVFAPPNTLRRVQMSPSDLHDIQRGYSFPLTQEEIRAYNVNYVGRQRVDEIDCYVFDVSPRVIEKKKRYLQGSIWVDATDLQIVVTDGRMIPDETRKGSEDLHPPFMTWRAQVDGHYWFPVYTKGEGMLHFAAGKGYAGQDVHLRTIIKYGEYRQFGSSARILYEGQELPAASEPAPPPIQPK